MGTLTNAQDIADCISDGPSEISCCKCTGSDAHNNRSYAGDPFVKGQAAARIDLPLVRPVINFEMTAPNPHDQCLVRVETLRRSE